MTQLVGFPAPVVTKAGKAGELEGDVLRGCTAWSAGFAAAGDPPRPVRPYIIPLTHYSYRI